MKNCNNCGRENLDEAVFCAGCGSPLQQASAPEAPVVEPVVETAPVTAEEPAAGQPSYTAPAYDASAYTAPADAPAAPAQANKATLWLILNIVGTVLCCLTNIFTIIGIVFAAIGMGSYNKGDYEDMNKKVKISMIMFIIGMAGAVLGLILSFAGMFTLPFLSLIGQ